MNIKERAIVLFCLLIPFTIAAQTTFAPVGAKWTYLQGIWSGPDTNLAVLEVVSDTIIDGRVCSMLHVDQGWFGCHEFVQYFTESNDSLFYYDVESDQFHLLFRWNANIGETWSTPVAQASYLDTLDWAVLDTGHVVIDGLQLRTVEIIVDPRQFLLYSESWGWITERLGGIVAPFTWILGACDAESFQGLRCYEDPDISWLNPQFPQCELSTSISEAALLPTINWSPSVLQAGTPCTLTSTDVRVARLEALDASGRRVISVVAASGHAVVQFADPGCYVLRWETSGGTRIQPIIVQ